MDCKKSDISVASILQGNLSTLMQFVFLGIQDLYLLRIRSAMKSIQSYTIGAVAITRVSPHSLIKRPEAVNLGQIDQREIPFRNQISSRQIDK